MDAESCAAYSRRDDICRRTRTHALFNSLLSGPDAAWPLIRRLFAEDGRRYIPRYLLALFFMAIVALTTAATAWLMENVVDDVIVSNDQNKVYWVASACVLVFLFKGLATYTHRVILARIGNSIVATIQKRLYAHVLSQDLAFHQRLGGGDLITHMSVNVAAARNALDLIVTSVGRDLLTLVALIAVMVIKDPIISGIVLLVAPLAVIGISYLVRKVRSVAKEQFNYLTHIVAAMQETVGGIRVVKAFNLEDKMRARMGSAVESVETRANRMASLGARSSPIMETLGGCAIAAVIVYAGWSVRELGRTPGEIVAFLTAMLLAYDPAKRLAKLSVSLRQNLVGADLLYQVLDTEPTLLEDPDAKTLVVDEGRIEIEGLTFAYADIPAMNNVTLEVAPRSVTALVGPSGAGKSTAVAMIERFNDPQQGRVLIDGQDIRDVTLASLRENLAFVSQDTFLFAGTVRENIAFGRMNATEEQIIEAAKNANADEFIIAMRGGYDAEVGTDGDNLSGGQRQRIAIARAMLRDAPILLLDEATSALDAQAEAKVQEALERLMKGRTTLVIAHRLSTIRNADMIHVMDGGEVVQSGTHEDLIAKGGLYAHLHALQFRDEAAA